MLELADALGVSSSHDLVVAVARLARLEPRAGGSPAAVADALLRA